MTTNQDFFQFNLQPGMQVVKRFPINKGTDKEYLVSTFQGEGKGWEEIYCPASALDSTIAKQQTIGA